MRFAWLLWLPLSAHADLYRWIDPATGTPKYSTLPPSDPRIESEVVPYKAPPPPKPAPGIAKPAASAELEVRWRSLATQLASIPAEELKSGSDRVRQHVQALEAARTELDRLDPAGASRRSAEMAAIMQRSLNRPP